MGNLKGKLESLKSTNGGERGDEHIGLFCRNEQRWKKRDVGKDREKYKYSLSSNGHLSAAVPP